MAAARVEPALDGGWVLCIPLPGGGEERLACQQHEQAEQGFALFGLYTALQAGDAAEVQRLADVVQADDESLAEMGELSLPELIQMLRLSLEEAAADSGEEPPPPASDNNATPSQNAHGTMISMNSTAAGTHSPQDGAAAPTAAIKQEPEPLIKTEEGQVVQPAGGSAAPAPAAAPAAANGPAEPMQLDEQPWDGMDVDDDAVGSDYPGVTRLPPSGGSGGSTTLGWQVALLVRLDAAGSPAVDAKPTEQLFGTATELEAALASDLAQLWQEQHCGPQSFGAFGREGHFNQSWFNHSVASYSLDAPLWAALAQLSTFSEFQAYLLQLQACGFLGVAAQTYSELQLPPEPWPDPKPASGCGTAVQPSSSPSQGAGGGNGGAGGGRMRREAWQPLGAGPAAGQQPAPQPPAGQQRAPQQAASPGGSPQGRAAVGASGSGGGSSADERLLKATFFSGLAYIQQAGKWRAVIPFQAQAGEPSKKPIILAHQQPMVAAVARDLAVFWRLDIRKQQGDGRGVQLQPPVLRDRYAADAGLVQQLTAASSIEQLRALLRTLRDRGTLGRLASELRQQLQQQLSTGGDVELPSPRQRRRQPRQPQQAQQHEQAQQQLHQPEHPAAEQPQSPRHQQEQQEQQPDVPAQQAGQGGQAEAAAEQLLPQASLQHTREAVEARMGRLRDQAAQEAEEDAAPLQQGGPPVAAPPAEQVQQPARSAEQGQPRAQCEEAQRQAQVQVEAQRAQQQGDRQEQQAQAVQQQTDAPLPRAPVLQPAPAAEQAPADRQESNQSLQLFFQKKPEQPQPQPQPQPQQQQQRGSQPQPAQPASKQPPPPPPPPRQQQQQGRSAVPAERHPSCPPGGHPGSKGDVQQGQQQRPRQHGHQQKAHQYPHHAKQAWQKEQQRLQRWTGGRAASPASPRKGMQGWPQGPMAAQPVPMFVPGPVLVPMDAAMVSLAAQQYQQQQLAAMAAHQQAAAAAWPQQMAAAPHLAAADMHAQAAMYNAQQQQQAAAAMQAAGMQSYGSGPLMLPPYTSGWPSSPHGA